MFRGPRSDDSAMDWQNSIPALRRRLQSQGLAEDYRVISRIPVRGYSLLICIPSAALGLVVVVASKSVTVTLVAAAMVASLTFFASAWARAKVVVAGSNWVATHGLFGWSTVHLDQLQKVDSWVDKSGTYLHLKDSQNNRVSLDCHTAVPKLRPVLAHWTACAEERGMKVDPLTTRILGLPDTRTESERSRAQQQTKLVFAAVVLLAVVPLFGAGAAGIVAGLAIAGVAVFVMHFNHPADKTAGIQHVENTHVPLPASDGPEIPREQLQSAVSDAVDAAIQRFRAGQLPPGTRVQTHIKLRIGADGSAQMWSDNTPPDDASGSEN